jgi:hypothetical protein
MGKWWNAIKEGVSTGAEVAEHLGSNVPGVGTIVHGAEAAYDLGAAGIDMAVGDKTAHDEHVAEMELNAAEAIPVVGTGIGLAHVGYDCVEGDGATERIVQQSLVPGGDMAENPVKYEDLPPAPDQQ